jgi:hypothetical protein
VPLQEANALRNERFKKSLGKRNADRDPISRLNG